MSDVLRLHVHFDGDGTAELFAEVEANGFRGRGSAWIDPGQLSELGINLAQAFPLRQPLQIAGGYWSRSEPSTLDQEHLALAFYPVEGRGVVGCQIRLSSPVQSDERPESRQLLQTELLTSYEELRNFADCLGKLAAGKIREAILHGIEV